LKVPAKLDYPYLNISNVSHLPLGPPSKAVQVVLLRRAQGMLGTARDMGTRLSAEDGGDEGGDGQVEIRAMA
jgi:hypothetical protein